ncbi:MAG: ABC transporter substrate-binding protein [Armatimonadota bacterium]
MRVHLIALAVSLSLVFFAAPYVGAQAPEGRVVVGFNAGFDSLDPHRTVILSARMVMKNIYDPLIERNPRTGEFQPALATAWRVSEDGKTIVLALRRDVRFHDGAPLDAAAVKFSLDRIRSPETRSPAAGQLTLVDRIDVVDQYTLRVVMREPFAPILDSLTDVNLSPVSPAAVAKYGPDFGQHPTGTGPFRLKDWRTIDVINLERNPEYQWAPAMFGQRGPTRVTDLVFRVLPEDTTRLALLERGTLNVMMAVPPREVARMRRDSRYAVPLAIRPGLPRVLQLNTSRPPFNDVRVRQAVAFAIDRDEILQAIFEGVGQIASGVLSPITWGYWKGGERLAHRTDLERARTLLTEAGWRPGADGILVRDGRPFRATTYTLSGPLFVRFAELIQAQLRRVGMDVTIRAIEQAAFVPAQQRGEPDFTGMIFPATDPDILFIVAHSSQAGPPGWNAAHYKDAELDRLLEEGRVTLDLKRREQIYARVQEMMLQRLPYIPYYVQTDIWATRVEVKGLGFDARALPTFYPVAPGP